MGKDLWVCTRFKAHLFINTRLRSQVIVQSSGSCRCVVTKTEFLFFNGDSDTLFQHWRTTRMNVMYQLVSHPLTLDTSLYN